MALETKDIRNAADMRRYVEGCLNDLIEGISSKEETMGYLHDYTLRVIDLTAECVSQNASTSDEALPIADVGVSLQTVKMEWILIKDKTPEKSGHYLVTNGEVILICGLLPNGVFYGIGGATHWMELPKLPIV